MIPSQGPTPTAIPPLQTNNPLFQPNTINNTPRIMNVPDHPTSAAFVPVSASATAVMEGIPPPSSSMTINLFCGISTPCLDQPSLIHQDTPSNGPLTRDLINPVADVVTFAPQNNAFLHGLNNNNNNNNNNTNSAQLIWDFSQRTAVIPTHAVAAASSSSSSSYPPPPPLVSGGHGSVLRARTRIEEENDHRDNVDGEMRRQRRRVEVQNDGNNTDSMIKGQWTPDEDRFCCNFYAEFHVLYFLSLLSLSVAFFIN